MSDEEVIATFMEPHKVTLHDGARSVDGWWVRKRHNIGSDAYDLQTGPWVPAMLAWNDCTKLGKCHEIEARLTEDQWEKYMMSIEYEEGKWTDTMLVHLSAAQKISALAKALRCDGVGVDGDTQAALTARDGDAALGAPTQPDSISSQFDSGTPSTQSPVLRKGVEG